jgi:DNA-directed RNA polymerase subunit RPC12/RpoP
MREYYYECSECSKITKSIPATLSEAIEAEGALDSPDTWKGIAGRGVVGSLDLLNSLSGGLFFEGLGLIAGGRAFKCTECGYVRGINSSGEEEY